jgi:hypothetical protein
LVSIKDVKHFLEPTFLDGVSFALLIAEESTTQGGKVGQRHQPVTVIIITTTNEIILCFKEFFSPKVLVTSLAKRGGIDLRK